MRKIARKVIIFILGCLTAFSLCGCNYKGYEGEHVDLYTEAVNSILGVQGFYDSPSLADPVIEILETDDYGRVMYGYLESGRLSVLIAQKADDDYVYYYPDFNFIFASDCENSWEVYKHPEKIDEYVKEYFSEEEINNLKELNDFGKAFDEDKCIKKQIAKKHEEPELSKKTKAKLDALCIAYAKDAGCKGEDTVFRYASFCTYDDYGRMLYLVAGVHRDVKGEGISPDSEEMWFNWVIILNPDFSFDSQNSMMSLDLENYQNELKEFKELHNWNKPL